MNSTKNRLFGFTITFLLFSLIGCNTANPNSSIDSNPTSSSGETSSEEVPPSTCDHQYVTTFVEPTMTDKGYDLHKCSKCGHEYRDNYTGLFNESQEEDGLSFLFIGNSYTFFVSENAYPYTNSSFMNFKMIAESAGFVLGVDNVTTGGYSLMQHADPTNDDGALLRQKLEENYYDLAFMQEQSVTPVTRPAKFYEGARSVNKLLKAKNIRGCFYETWGRKAESTDLERYGLTNDTMTQILIGNYGAIADELDLPVSHVGTAFFDVYNNHGDIIDLYNSDNYHPSLFGSYLIAYVHYATVYGRSPVGMDVFGYQYEGILQQAAHDAVFGESILREEYRTSSVGIGLTISESERTIDLDPTIPDEFVNTGYHKGVGDWTITKDDNGITSFASKTNKCSLLFDQELFEGSGTLSFDLKVDGNFTGASTQGIVFGSSSDQISWTTSSDTFYTVGRDRYGHMGLTTIFRGGVGNEDAINPSIDLIMEDVTRTYNIKLVVDRTNWIIKSYVNGEFAGFSTMGDHLTGKYIGISSGLNGGAIISNIQVNGKGLNVTIDEGDIPPEEEVLDFEEFTDDADVNITHDGVKRATNEQGHKAFYCYGENGMFVLKNITLTNNMTFEFDAKFSADYSGACVQGVALGCPDANYSSYSIGASGQIGRLKSGKTGGVVIENDTEKTKATQIGWGYATQTAKGDALNAMTDATKTYHIKVIYRYISDTNIEADLYVNTVFSRSLSFTSASHNFGSYIGFTNGKDGDAIYSNIQIGGSFL